MMASSRDGGSDALAVSGRTVPWGSPEARGLESGRLVVGPASSSAHGASADQAALEGVYSWMQQRLKHATPQAEDGAEDWEAWSDRQRLGVEQAKLEATLQARGGKHGGGGTELAVLPVAPSASAASSASSLRQGASSVSSASTLSSAPSGEDQARARPTPTRQQPLPQQQQQQQQQTATARRPEGGSGARAAPKGAFGQPGKKMLACFTGDTGASPSVPPSPLPANAAAAAALGAQQQQQQHQHNALAIVASDDSSLDVPAPESQLSMETRAPPSLPSPVAEYGRHEHAGTTATALLARGGIAGGLGHLYTLPGLGVATARQMKARAAAARAAAQARVAALEEEELGLTLLLDDLAHEQEDARFRKALFRLHSGREGQTTSSSSPLDSAEQPHQGSSKGGLRDWAWRRTAGKSHSSGSGSGVEQRAVDRLPRMIVLSGAPLEHEAPGAEKTPGLRVERGRRLGLRGWQGVRVDLSGTGADYAVLHGLPGRVHLLVYSDFGVVFLLFGMLLCGLGGFIVSVPTWAPSPAATASFLALGLILRAVLLFAHIMMLSMVPSLPAPAPAPLPKQPALAEEGWAQGPGKEGQEVLALPSPEQLEELEEGRDQNKGSSSPGGSEEEEEDEVLQIEVRAAAAAAAGGNPSAAAPGAAPALEDAAEAKARAKAVGMHRANATTDPMSGDEWLNALCYAWLDVWVALLCVYNNLMHAMPLTLPIAIWFVARGAWLELMVIFSSSYEERRRHWLPILTSIWPPVVVGSLLLVALPTAAPWYAAMQLGLACVIDGLPLWLASLGFQFNVGNGAAADSTYFFQAAAEAEASGAFWLGAMRLLPILALVLGFAKA